MMIGCCRHGDCSPGEPKISSWTFIAGYIVALGPGGSSRDACIGSSTNKKWRIAGANVAILQGHESVLLAVPKGQNSDTGIYKRTLSVNIDAMLAATRCTRPQFYPSVWSMYHPYSQHAVRRSLGSLLVAALVAAVLASARGGMAADPPTARSPARTGRTVQRRPVKENCQSKHASYPRDILAKLR